MTKPEDSVMNRRLRSAAKRQREAIDHFRATVREAVESGMSYRAIGRAAGVTFQRVHQIVKEEEK